MIKRIVILQDEQLVVREMMRSVRPAAAYATAAVGAGADYVVPVPSEPEEDEGHAADAADDDAPQPEVPVAMAPAGSRLAEVAKAAAIKAERVIIEDTLRQMHWNRRRAAEQLGVSYKTLLNKIKECGISRK
jgi:DNA-binding NtrC family response regulator